MSTNEKQFHDIRIDSYQRSILASALLTYICEVGFQNNARPEDLEEAQVLLSALGEDGRNLTQGVINDLRPEN